MKNIVLAKYITKEFTEGHHEEITSVRHCISLRTISLILHSGAMRSILMWDRGIDS